MNDQLSFRELRLDNQERASEWRACDPGSGKPIPGSFSLVELLGEIGEAANELKKLWREDLGLRGGKSDVVDYCMELADIIICLDLALIAIGAGDIERVTGMLLQGPNRAPSLSSDARFLSSEARFLGQTSLLLYASECVNKIDRPPSTSASAATIVSSVFVCMKESTLMPPAMIVRTKFNQISQKYGLRTWL